MTFKTIFGRTAFLAAALALSLAATTEARAACRGVAEPGVDGSGCDYTDWLWTAMDLSGANLSGTTWEDGRICAEGSVGVCN